MPGSQETAGALIGELIDDRYRIRRLIGRGGMGAVYEAEATRLDRLCAFKALLPEYTKNETAVQRFRREAQVAARVKHPNVVEIFDTGTTAGGLGYIAMELLHGESLDRTLQRDRRIPWPRARHITLQICRALAAAHAKHIVHRDMKPENCFRLTVEDDPDYIKVLDFGIAKLTDPGDETNARLTATNSVIGTYAYMAFEQVSGLDCDHRVDIWAVGVILYEMLTGTLPFKGQNQGQIWTAIFQQTPPPVRDIVPDADIPEAVDAIVARALAKNREARYPTIEALALDLAAVGVTGTAPGLTALGGFLKNTGNLPLAAALVPPVDSPAARPTVVQAVNRTERVDPLELTALQAGPIEDATRPAQRTELAPTTDPANRTQLAPPTDPSNKTQLAPPRERHPTVQGPADGDLLAPEPAPRRRVALFGGLAAIATAVVVWLATRPSEDPVVAPTIDPTPPVIAAPETPIVKPEPVPVTPPEDPPEILDEPPPVTPPATTPTKKKATPAKPPKPARTYASKVNAELNTLRQSAAMRECFTSNDATGKLSTLTIEISAATGKATSVELPGLIRGTGLHKCVERTIKAFQFSKGGPGDANFSTRGFVLNK